MVSKSCVSFIVILALLLTNVTLSARTERGPEKTEGIRKTANAEGLNGGDSEKTPGTPIVRASPAFEKKSGKSNLPYILGGLAAGGIIVALLLLRKDPKPQTGTIQVNSTPTGARILFNGSDTGKVTNASLTDISPGTHTVKLVKEGYVEREEQVTVTAGQTATVNITLPQHTLTVTSPVQEETWVPGHEFEIRWTTGGSAALSAFMAAGSRLAESKSPRAVAAGQRAAALERPVAGRAGERLAAARGERPDSGIRAEARTVSADKGVDRPALEGETRSFSHEFSGSAFSGAPVIQDESGVLILTRVGIKLFRGASEIRTIVASTDNSGAYRWTIPADLAEAADYKIRIFCADAPEVYGDSPNFRLSRSGTIQVRSTPTGAKVYLNNEDTGKTTNCTLTDVPFGTHTVKISKDGYVDHTASVNVVAGQVPTVDVTLTAYSIVVEAPTANMLWPKTRSLAITWRTPAADEVQSEAVSGDQTADGGILALTHVRIELWKGSTRLSPDIASSRPYTPGTEGTFNWAPAAGLVDGHDYKIRIVAIGGTADGEIYGESAPFSIVHWYDFVLKWGIPRMQFPYGFHLLYGLAISGTDRIYVSDEEFIHDFGYRIQIFSLNGAGLGSIQTGVHPAAGSNFKAPRGMVVDPSGDLYFVDSGNHRIRIIMATSPYLLIHWGSRGAADGQFEGPRGMAMDNAGNIYVADSGNHRIQKFTADGVFVAKWGTLGTGNGQFNSPSDVVVDHAGNVYVTDAGNHRIQKFTANGTYVTQWGSQGSGHGQFNAPMGIAVDGAGDVFVADTNNHRIQKFTSNGDFLTLWGGLGSADGQLSSPHGIAVDNAGDVYVADRGNDRVQRFRRIG